jgi:glutathione S-transferase
MEDSMNAFTVYTVPGSPFGRTVLAMLEKKGAPYRIAPVAPGTLKTPEHLMRHAFGPRSSPRSRRLPALRNPGHRPLSGSHPLQHEPHASRPKSGGEDGSGYERLDWYLFQGVNNVIGFHRVVAPRVLGLAPDEEAIAQAMPKAEVVFKELSRLLDSSPVDL